VRYLAGALSPDIVEQDSLQARANLFVTSDIVAEEFEAELVNSSHVVMCDVNAVLKKTLSQRRGRQTIGHPTAQAKTAKGKK